MLGLSPGLELIIGTVVGLKLGLIAWTVGFAVHLVIAGAIGVLYGWVFDAIVRNASTGLGVAFGLVHGGAAIAISGAMQQWLLTASAAPGGTFRGMWDAGGADITVFFAAHAIYGAVVGGVYGRVRDGPPPVGG
jgi:hypothetical protein